MADGGASSMILLVTSLLISGAASVVLLDSWGDLAVATGTNAKGKALMQKPMFPSVETEEMFYWTPLALTKNHLVFPKYRF